MCLNISEGPSGIEISFNIKSIFDEDPFVYFPAVSSSSSVRNLLKILDITRNHPLVYSGAVDCVLASQFASLSRLLKLQKLISAGQIRINHERNVVAMN